MLADLPDEEASAFREGASALEDVVRRLFAALDLVSFLTASDKETRAWTLRHGLTAFDAAAAIHTDIANGFIRAEVIRWDDLVECGSHAEAARRGLQRLEGKSYVVEDGDVLVPKTTFSAVLSSDLSGELARRGFDTAVVGGLTTPICVQTTVDALSMTGTKVCLVTDACASQPMGGLSAEEAHDAAVQRMGYLFASVTTTAELIDRIAPG